VAGQDAADGTPFGRYRLIELLGRGGMGEVWRAFDTDTDRIVALKVLPPHLSEDVDFQRRFRREAHAAARLNNPHVIPIHHYGEIDGRLYVDMRLIDGRDLHSVLADGPLAPARAVRIIEQVAKALHAAHKVGLVHRDVKPSNILLDEDDFAYLIDFGIARAAGETSLTATGGFIGSWPYMAPERFGPQEVDARADVYALACVLYQCLTGHTPYPGNSLEQQYAGHVATPPPEPSRANPNVPAGFDWVTAKGLAKDRNQRYGTTVELARAAVEATTDTLDTHRPPSGRPPNPIHLSRCHQQSQSKLRRKNCRMQRTQNPSGNHPSCAGAGRNGYTGQHKRWSTTTTRGCPGPSMIRRSGAASGWRSMAGETLKTVTTAWTWTWTWPRQGRRNRPTRQRGTQIMALWKSCSGALAAKRTGPACGTTKPSSRA